MSRLLVSYGADAVHHLQPLLAKATHWQQLGSENGAFAWQAESFDIAAENGGPFLSPDGACIGVLAGTVFDIEQQLSAYPQALPRQQRLGLWLQTLYQSHGEDFPSQLDGAFVIVMALANQLIAARDAIGERLLYVLEHKGGILIADRMAPLILHPACGRRLHPGAAVDYLGTGFCPFERTPVQGISKLLPGSTWIIQQRRIRRHQYHRITEAEGPLSSLEDYTHLLRERLLAAVEKRWIEGRQTALLLSGGLDSSLVGALLGGDRLCATYSLSFGEQYRNELVFSSLMAQHLGIPHRIVTVLPSTIRRELPTTMTILDEPIGDPLTVPNVIVAREAAREAEVIFNGEGGDPLFGGPKNLPMLAVEAYAGKELSRETLYLTSYNKGWQLLDTLMTLDFTHAVQDYPATVDLLAPYLHDQRLQALLNRLMSTNLRLKGAAQILPKVFKVASAAGLVVRSPLFDRQLAETAFVIPPDLKLHGSIEKYILKRVAEQWVPAQIVHRPKSGMLVPVQFWFRKELRGFARDSLLSRQTRIAPITNRNAINRLLAFKGSGVRGYHGNRIWLLLSLEWWMRVHEISGY